MVAKTSVCHRLRSLHEHHDRSKTTLATIVFFTALFVSVSSTMQKARAQDLTSIAQTDKVSTSQPWQCQKNTLKIAIDIGHDKSRPGATSARGLTEFSYNAALGKLLLQTLRVDGFREAFLIGQDGTPMPLLRRPEIAREAKAVLFISLHHDSAQKQFFSTWGFQGRVLPYSDMFHGYSIFISGSSRWKKENLRFATSLGHALRDEGLMPSLHHAELIQGENRTLIDRELGIYQFDQLAVLRSATMPALLLESGVIVNRDEEQAIQSGAYHPKIVAALLSAITQYCQ